MVLGGIEEIPSKIGVFSRTQKLRSEWTRDSRGFSTWLEGLGSLQRVTQSSRNTSSSRGQESTKENQNSIKTRYENKGIQKPRGHKEGTASFPTQSQYKVSRIHTSNPREEQRKNKEREKEETAPGGRKRAGLFCLARRREERGEGYLRCPRRGPKYPRLKLDTKTPIAFSL